jgi:hypothetical protein
LRARFYKREVSNAGGFRCGRFQRREVSEAGILRAGFISGRFQRLEVSEAGDFRTEKFQMQEVSEAGGPFTVCSLCIRKFVVVCLLTKKQMEVIRLQTD